MTQDRGCHAKGFCTLEYEIKWFKQQRLLKEEAHAFRLNVNLQLQNKLMQLGSLLFKTCPNGRQNQGMNHYYVIISNYCKVFYSRII